MAVGVFGICGMLDGEFGEWLVRGCVFFLMTEARPGMLNIDVPTVCPRGIASAPAGRC